MWKSSGTSRHLSIVVSTILALLALVFVLTGLQDVTTIDAAGTTRYVDGASGVDAGDCSNPGTPCESIGYALSQAAGGDSVQVAQGVYTENLTVDQNAILEGGYEASGWNRDIAQYKTIVDGSSGQYVIGDWDGRQVVKPSVMIDGLEYKMWFDGGDVVDHTAIGLATSADAIDWIKDASNPVLTGTASDWDESGEHAPFVLKEDGVYKMWYEGSQGDIRQLGYATSTNGLEWTKYPGNPVLTVGPAAYDEGAVGHGSVINDNGTYKLWYHAIGDEGAIIAYATSPDGVNWTKQGPALESGNPAWDESLWGPSVLKIDGTYWMWYSAGGNEGTGIGVVTSTNGLSWNRFLTTPIITDTEGSVGDPHVIDDNGKLKMWYSYWYDDVGSGTWRGRIDYAESDDGINWVKYIGNPALPPGNLGQEGQPVVAFVAGSSGSVLDGFTIQNGYAPYGAGVHLSSAAVIVRNNTIVSNTALYAGGGINANSGSVFTITNNAISNNQAKTNLGGGIGSEGGSGGLAGWNHVFSNTAGTGGGGIGAYEVQGAITLVGNDVHDNVAGWSGGLMVDHADASITIRQNHVYSNEVTVGGPGGIQVIMAGPEISITQNIVHANIGGSGGGIAVWDVPGAQVTVDRNDVRFNQAFEASWTAGGVSITDADGPVTVSNNVIVDNQNEGMEGANFSEMLLVNNTIVRNGTRGVEMFAWPSEPPEPFTATLTNNIIVGHGECGVTGFNGVSIVANHNDVWDNVDDYCAAILGSGNISDNPLFINNPDAGNYRLLPDSPAIDTGTDAGAPNHDIDGNPRPSGAGFDMGAYEMHNYEVYFPLVMKNYDGACCGPTSPLSPPYGASLNTIAPLFSYDTGDDPEAIGSRLEVARDAQFTQAVAGLWSGTVQGVNTFRFSWNFEPATTYYWRTWLMYNGSEGPYSNVWSFTTGSGGTILPAPSQLAPADSSMLPMVEADLEWTAVSGADEYLLHWKATDQNWRSIMWVEGTQAHITWLDPGKTYEWWVSARNEYAIGEDSATWRFSTPAGPTSTSPQDSSSGVMIEEGNVIYDAGDG